MRSAGFISLGFLIFFLLTGANAEAQKKLIVSKDGKGDFTTIQAAIESLKDSVNEDRVIFIRKGTYNEKLFIRKNHLVLEGEDRSNTIITFAIARDEWRCEHPDDWGVATLNIGASDITLKNLTITNSFGWDWKADRIVPCPNDTAKGEKKISKYGHQMALRTMYGTRMKAINCHFRSFGGDTVSPWEVESGLWYFKDCTMEGGVDFYCPRGWA